MKCPNCGEELHASINKHTVPDADYVEVEFTCTNNHSYFVRIKKDDLIEGQPHINKKEEENNEKE